jgi:hypothetical protein
MIKPVENISLTHFKSTCGKFWQMKPDIANQYQASLESQLQDWVNGVDRHTTDLPANISSECTPDMACCSPNTAWPKSARRKFIAANEADREVMLFAGLPKSISGLNMASKLYIACKQGVGH